MPVPEVLAADEWVLDGQRYPITGPVQITGLSVLPGRVEIGASDRDHEQIRSSWILEDWAGGLGVVELDEATQSDRYAYGTLDTRLRRTATRLPRPETLGTGVPASTDLRTGVVYGTTLYGAWNTKIRALPANSTTWLTPTETGYADLTANGTDSAVVRLSTTDWLLIADANGLLRFDGTTWTYQAGNGTTIPRSQWICEWNGNLYSLDPNGLLWLTPDLVTWTIKDQLPLPAGEARGLLVFFNADEKPELHAPTRDGLWLYNADIGTTGQWFRTRVTFPRYPTAGAAAEWRGDLFEASALDVYHWTGRVVSPTGLSRDDGLPADWQGDIVKLLGTHQWLVAAVGSNPAISPPPAVQTTSGAWRVRILALAASRAMLFAWTGAAWHPLWMAGTTGTAVLWLGTTSGAGKRYLVWGSAGTCYRQPLPLGVFNPRETPDWTYADEGELVSGWFDSGKPEVLKVALDFEARLLSASATALAEIYYALDGETCWHSLLTQTVDHAAAPTLFGPDGEGVLFYKIRCRVVLRAPLPATPLALDFAVLTYLPEVRRLYGLTATIDLSEPRTSRALEVALQATLAKPTLLASGFRRAGQAVGPPNRVFISRYQGLVQGGTSTQGKHTLQVIGV